jgi:hypothetical protein
MNDSLSVFVNWVSVFGFELHSLRSLRSTWREREHETHFHPFVSFRSKRSERRKMTLVQLLFRSPSWFYGAVTTLNGIDMYFRVNSPSYQYKGDTIRTVFDVTGNTICWPYEVAQAICRRTRTSNDQYWQSQQKSTPKDA